MILVDSLSFSHCYSNEDYIVAAVFFLSGIYVIMSIICGEIHSLRSWHFLRYMLASNSLDTVSQIFWIIYCFWLDNTLYTVKLSSVKLLKLNFLSYSKCVIEILMRKVGILHVYLLLSPKVLILVFSKLLLLGPVNIHLRFTRFFENLECSEVTLKSSLIKFLFDLSWCEKANFRLFKGFLAILPLEKTLQWKP